jgi:hypothetical protein
MSTHKFQLPTIKKPKINAKNTYDFFDFVKKYVTVLSIIFAVILLILHYYEDRKDDLTKLEEFSVTESLVKKGFTSDALRSKILLEVEKIINIRTTASSRGNAMAKILSSKPVDKFAIEDKEGKSDYDVKAMIRNIKTWTFAKDKIIRGHFYEEANEWKLLLKMPHSKNYNLSILTNQPIDTLIAQCAIQIVETMHPQYLVRYYLIKNNLKEAIRLSKIHDFDTVQMTEDEVKLSKINKILIVYKSITKTNRDTTEILLKKTLSDVTKFKNNNKNEILGYALEFAIYSDLSINHIITTDTSSLTKRDILIQKTLEIAINTRKNSTYLNSDFVELNEIRGWMYSISANLIGLISDSMIVTNLFTKFRALPDEFAEIKTKDSLAIWLQDRASKEFPIDAFIQNNRAYSFINPASICFYSDKCPLDSLKSQKPNLDKAISILDSISAIYPKDSNLKDSQAEAFLYLWQIEKKLNEAKQLKHIESTQEKKYKNSFYNLITEALKNEKEEDDISKKLYKTDYRWLFFNLLCEDEFRNILECKNNVDCPCENKNL